MHASYNVRGCQRKERAIENEQADLEKDRCWKMMRIWNM
jgi:hypothetical protein